MENIIDNLISLLTYDPKSPLIFSSGLFLFVFAIFTFFYSFMRRKTITRIIYVTCFSLFFYYKSSGWYFLLIMFTATSDFFIGKAIAAEKLHKFRKWFLGLGIFIDLGLLAYFKYTNFFIQTANDLNQLGVFKHINSLLGFKIFGEGLLDLQNIFLPIGISFFIFQSISYTIDIYRKRIEPLTNWLDYLFFLSFFPLLLAGPIVRARDFIYQIRQNPLVVTKAMFGTAIFLIMTGLFKKAIISDYISLNFVDRIFKSPELYSGFENLMGVYGYGLQIYCDFSGYSDMAIGIALMLGFKINKNFDSPYQSATITEFWRRWHISLSSWLKDYLYISLGGNRKGKFRTYVNLFITMLLGGLWHGAALRYVLWGAIHGVALAGHKLIMTIFPGFKAEGKDMPWARRILGVIFTFNLVCFSWIFFRAKDMATAKTVLTQIFTDFRFALIPDVIIGYANIFGLILLGYLLHMTPARWEDIGKRIITNAPLIVKAIGIVIIIWCVMQIKSSDIQPFIYFQF